MTEKDLLLKMAVPIEQMTAEQKVVVNRFQNFVSLSVERNAVIILIYHKGL